jgi:hypothetical protein
MVAPVAAANPTHFVDTGTWRNQIAHTGHGACGTCRAGGRAAGESKGTHRHDEREQQFSHSVSPVPSAIYRQEYLWQIGITV